MPPAFVRKIEFYNVLGDLRICLRYRGSLESSSGCLWRPASLTICLISMPIIKEQVGVYSIQPIESALPVRYHDGKSDW